VNIFVTCHGNKIQIKPMKTTGASSIFSWRFCVLRHPVASLKELTHFAV
jgi:hypothetical protein